MKYYRRLLLLVLITLLSGAFTVSRLNLGWDFEVRYVFILALLFIILLHKARVGSSEKMIALPKRIISFMTWNYFFMLLLSVTAFYSKDKFLSLDGVVDLIVVMLLLVVILYALSNDNSKDCIDYIIMAMMLIGIIYLVPILLSVAQGNLRGQSISGPNVSTRILFFSTCCAIYFWKTRKKAIYFLLALSYIGGIILLGSRGGVVGALGTAMVLFTINFFSNIKRIRFKINLKNIFTFVIGIAAVYMLREPILKVINERIIGATFRNNGEIYTAGRDSIYSDAINLIKEQPLWGYGINSFNHYSYYGFPHNLLLELLFNMGILGGVYFLLLLLHSIKIILQYRNTNLYIISGIPFYMIMVQMFSGGLYDFRYYYFWMVLLIFYHATGQVEKVEIKRKVAKVKKSATRRYPYPYERSNRFI